MKRIQQTEQLSDRERKAVLRGDEASLGSLIREDAANVIAGSAGSAIARIMSKTKTAFQRERMESEGFDGYLSFFYGRIFLSRKTLRRRGVFAL